VIVDEAQHVQPDVLEQIRLLANVHDDRGTLLQIVLVGQPDLQALLAKPELQQLRQRVTRSVSLNALTRDEVKQYIVHRLAVAREPRTGSPIPGAHDLARAVAEWNESSRPATFTDDAIQAVARISRGVPRLVNLLADRALEAAYAHGSAVVDAPTIDEAARVLQLPAAASDSAQHGEERPRARPRTYVIAGLAAALAGTILWLGGRALMRRSPPASTVVPPAAERPAAVEPPPPAVAPRVEERPAPAAPNAAAEPAGERFEIVVASFRTEAKAADVAARLASLGQPVHQRSRGGWQQVVAGPFASRAAADEAQRQLAGEGFTGTTIVPATNP
jgi:general secretion pathway protein A